MGRRELERVFEVGEVAGFVEDLEAAAELSRNVCLSVRSVTVTSWSGWAVNRMRYASPAPFSMTIVEPSVCCTMTPGVSSS
jgi:hypothetical protein